MPKDDAEGMRGWLWAGTGFAAFVSLLTILALLDAPRALEARPTSRSLASAVGGQSYTLGVENTSVSVQNAGLSAAKVVVDYYDPDGERVAQDTVQSLAAGASTVFDQADEAGLPHGFAGSAVVTADQAIRTIILKYIERGDELSVGADNGISNGFSRIYLPVVYSRFGLNGAWNTRFALQNVSTTATACVRLTYRQLDGTVAFTEPSPGAAPTPACPGGGLALPPQGTLLRNQADMSGQLPDQFEGSLIIELVTATGQPSVSGELLAATADIFNSERANFASYKGLGWNPSGTSDLSTTVLLPLIYKNFGEGNGWNTQYQISGADPDKATTVNVTYCCDSRLPGPGGSLKKTFSMQASASVSQALEDGLPDNFAGTAVITASQPIAVVDTMAWSFLDKASFGTFTAIPDSTASTSVWLPVVYKDFGFKGPLADADGWNSWFRVQVAHGGTANIQITYHGSGLPGGSASFSDSVTASKTFSQHVDPLLPANFQGAATITSDQPIVVVAGITSDAYEGDTDAIFAGFGPDLFPGPPPSGTVSLVQGWNDACYTGPQQPIEGALTGISDKVLALYRLRPDQLYDGWFAGRPDLSTIVALNPYESLFMLMGNGTTWAQQPSGTPPASANLVRGWNAVCYTGQTKAVETATLGISDQIAVIYALAPDGTWRQFVPGRPELTTLTTLEQFSALLVLVTEEGGAQWIFDP